MMKTYLAYAFLVCMVLTCVVAPAQAREKMLQGVHAQKSVMPKSCRSCHKGMTMALSGEEGACLPCHGSPQRQAGASGEGILRLQGRSQLQDIEVQLQKPYRHPVLTVRGAHQRFEALPEELANAKRHSECVDCHDPHLVEKGRPFRGLKGRRVGNFIADIENEYELCYRCHAESANLPGNSTNKHNEFKVGNPSFHPVEGEGRSTYVISLKEPYVPRAEKPGDVSTITCSDCHGNDDPDGPSGPHGSRHEGLLKLSYQMDDGLPESERSYALCYSCHDRSSILRDESFRYHSLHITGGGVASNGTSCFTCHDAHGSTQYQHLIRFNPDVVSPNADDKLKYDAQGYAARHGACFLNCHNVEHNPKEY